MKRLSSFISAALFALLLVISVMPASAVTTSNGTSYGLSIEPRKNYIINPGQTVTDKISVGNLDDTANLNLSLKVVDFTYTDQSGTPKLYLAANAPQTPWSIKPFMHFPTTTQISAGQTKTINFSIT